MQPSNIVHAKKTLNSDCVILFPAALAIQLQMEWELHCALFSMSWILISENKSRFTSLIIPRNLLCWGRWWGVLPSTLVCFKRVECVYFPYILPQLSLLCEPLLASFNAQVSTHSLNDLYRTTLNWVDQHCTLTVLRPRMLLSPNTLVAA